MPDRIVYRRTRHNGGAWSYQVDPRALGALLEEVIGVLEADWHDAEARQEAITRLRRYQEECDLHFQNSPHISRNTQPHRY